MPVSVDAIIDELKVMDPTLAAREDLRPLVVALLESRPDATIDPAFLRRLRTELFNRSVMHAEADTRPSFWWAMRLAPLGVIALLLLVLDPGTATRTIENPQIETRTMMVPDEGGAAGTAPAPESSVRMMQLNAGPSLSVPDQRPGDIVKADFITLDQPGFVAIYRQEDATGAALGVSALLPAGRSDGIAIPLTERMAEDETLYAFLYADDGDGVYGSGDTLIRDSALGTPMYAVFGVRAAADVPVKSL